MIRLPDRWSVTSARLLDLHLRAIRLLDRFFSEHRCGGEQQRTDAAGRVEQTSLDRLQRCLPSPAFPPGHWGGDMSKPRACARAAAMRRFRPTCVPHGPIAPLARGSARRSARRALPIARAGRPARAGASRRTRSECRVRREIGESVARIGAQSRLVRPIRARRNHLGQSARAQSPCRCAPICLRAAQDELRRHARRMVPRRRARAHESWARSRGSAPSPALLRSGACRAELGTPLAPGRSPLQGAAHGHALARKPSGTMRGDFMSTVSRRTRWGALAAALLGLSAAPAANAAETIKVGILHSLSGTMAISETSLKDVALMTIDDDQRARAAILGRKLEPVVVDPASNWPLFAEKARELLDQAQGRGGVRLLDLGLAQVRAAGVRGAQRPALLPGAVRGRGVVVQRLLHRRGAEPAGDPGGRVPDERGRRRRQALGAARHRLRVPAHDQQDPPLLPHVEGREGRGHHGGVHAVRSQRLPDDRREHQEVRRGQARRPSSRRSTATRTCRSTRSSPTQGLKAEDIPVVAFSVGEEELRGIDTKPLVGHLAAWNYFMSIDNPTNKRVHRGVEGVRREEQPARAATSA